MFKYFSGKGLNSKAAAPDFLPELVGQVSPLYGLHVEVQPAVLLAYRGVSAVCQRAGGPIA